MIVEPKINIDIDEDGRHGRVVVAPLERGYGTTLGNSMRRILLSSLPGAAITAIRISGVEHEFATIDHVKEDVTEIILNLKRLSVSIDKDEENKKAVIAAVGPKEVTAADIVANPGIHIHNPDLHIATLEKNAQLEMTMWMDTGRGYVPAEQNKNTRSKEIKEIDAIFIDSIFTPVTRVNFTVEDVRAGEVTNFDKLILDLWTDGSIEPDEGIAIAAQIMKEHLDLFIELGSDMGERTFMAEKEESGKDKALEMTIEELELPARPYNGLRRASIFTVEQLIGYTENDVRHLRNLGDKSITEIKAKLEKLGLSFKPEDDN